MNAKRRVAVLENKEKKEEKEKKEKKEKKGKKEKKKKKEVNAAADGGCAFDYTVCLSGEISKHLDSIAPIYKNNPNIQKMISQFRKGIQVEAMPYATLVEHLYKFIIDELAPAINEHAKPMVLFSHWAESMVDAILYNTTSTQGGTSGEGGADDAGDAGSPEYKCSDPLSGGALGFDDIKGAGDVKMDIQNNYLLPQQYPMAFPTDTDGILFYGPPGTGKTMFAKAASAELGHTAFYAPSAGSIRDKYEGGTEKNISALFECARKYVAEHGDVYRAILFIDEFDSIAGLRGEDASMTRSVNVLLQEMDGINSTANISVIAATNYPWSVDSAVQRRFSEKIMVDLPDADAKKGMIEEALKKYFCRHYKDPSKIQDVYAEIRNMTDERDDLVDEDFVSSLVGLGKDGITMKPALMTNMVNNDRGTDFIVNVAKNRKIQPYDFRDAAFGYSGSDISKMMQICAKRCGRRIFEGRKHYPRFKKYVKKDHTEEVYALKSYTENRETEGTVPLSEIKLSDHGKIINTIITKQDMKEAIASYAPTVNAETYMQLLLYKYHGIVPDQ